MRLLTLILFSLLVLASWTRAFAQADDVAKPDPVILTDEQEEYPLGLSLGILEDPSGELTIEDVASPEFDSRFAPSQVEVPNYGFTDSAYWVRLRLQNKTRLTDQWLLDVGFPNMQFVDLYTPSSEGGEFDVKQTGVLRALETRDILHPTIVLKLAIPPDDQQTYYVRFQNGASMTLPLTLWSPDAFVNETQQNQILHGLYFGALIALLLYNLFLLFSLREKTYLYLVLFLASAIIFETSYTGLAEIYIIPDLFFLKTPQMGLSYALMFISMVLFSDSFLELKTLLPKMHRANIIIVGIWAVLMLLALFLSYRNMVLLMVPWAAVSLVAVLFAGIMRWRQGSRSARFFMIAWLGLIASLLLVILVRFTIIPSTLLTENAYRLGLMWMAVIWSIALADRINVLRTETEDANRELLNSEHRLSQTLEGLPIGVVVYGTDQKPNYVNQRTLDILSNPAQGIGPDLSAGRTLSEAAGFFSFRVAGTDQAYPVEKIPVSRALEGEASSVDDLEADLVDKRVPLEVWGSPVRDDAGNIESAVVAFQDITRRKQIDAELAEYRKDLEHLVEERTTELHALEQILRQRIEWLSMFKDASQITGSVVDLPQAYKMLSARILQLHGARAVSILYWAEGGQLQALCRLRGEEPFCDVKKVSAPLLSDFPLRDEIERGDLLTIPVDQASSLPVPLSEWVRDTDSQSLLIAPMIFRESVVGVFGLGIPQPIEEVTQARVDMVQNMAHDLASLSEDAYLLDQARDLDVVKERNYLARELHDSVTQTLFTASVLAEATPLMWTKNPDLARHESERISELLRGALAEMRSLLLELRSDGLYNQSLSQMLSTLAEAVRSQSSAGITISIADELGLPKDVNLAFYRIAREALNNVINHAEAAQINISVLQEPGRVELRIGDDGVGFDPGSVPAGHLGINIMTERAEQIGGDLQINSEPGQGTEIIVTLPDSGGESEEHE